MASLDEFATELRDLMRGSELWLSFRRGVNFWTSSDRGMDRPQRVRAKLSCNMELQSPCGSVLK